MTTLGDLFDLAEKGYVLVFPTEESARSFSVRYVRERKKGLKASSAIAFDTFASSFYPRITSLDPATEIDRIIFSSHAASHLGSRFRYFSSSAFPEVRERLAPYIQSMLQSLPDASLFEKRSRKAEHDLCLIEKEYSSFLEAMSLYEPSFESMDIPELTSDHVLVMPSAFPKEERLVTLIRDNPHIHLADDLPTPEMSLLRYPCEKEEVRSLFLSIRRLLDDGVPFSDIVISTAAEERLRPYLEKESYLFGIPIEFVSGKSPLSYASGAFLSSLSDIHSSGYSLDSLKAFFLNRAIPFQKPEELLRFIEFSIANSITSAPKLEDDRYLRVPSSEGGSWYRTLRFTLDRLMTETRPERVLQHIHTLMSGLLIKEEFSLDEDDAAVYSFAMNELSSFLREARRAADAGYGISKPLFPLFISYLGGTRYVPRKKEGGIRVYPFTQDAAIPVRFRFIIALNEDESAVRVKKARFLSDYEIAGERGEDDITGAVLRCYASFSGELHLSASTETYRGYALPLSSVRSEECQGSLPDPWRLEASRLRSERIYPLQHSGHEAALASSLRRISPDDDLSFRMKGKPGRRPVDISFSAYSAYSHCPFTYALKYRFGLDHLPSFEPSSLDAAEMGTRLHRVLERYYASGSSDPEHDIPRLFEEEMSEWRDGTGLPPFAQRATDLMIASIRSVYLENLIAVIRGMDSMSQPVEDGLEKWLEAEFMEQGIRLRGRIDRLASTEEGLAVFDYKSRKSFSSKELERQGFQMYIYRLLARAALGAEVSRACFVTLRDGNISDFPFGLSDEEVLSVLSVAAEGIAEGDWHAISSDENCAGCAYRQICRRRFAVR